MITADQLVVGLPNSPGLALLAEGTVPLETQFPSTITLPYDNTAGFVMGVALANLSTVSANITASIWDDRGNQLGTQIFAMVGNGHTAFALPNQIPFTAGKRGIVKFQVVRVLQESRRGSLRGRLSSAEGGIAP